MLINEEPRISDYIPHNMRSDDPCFVDNLSRYIDDTQQWINILLKKIEKSKRIAELGSASRYEYELTSANRCLSHAQGLRGRQSKINDAERIITSAVNIYKPSHIVCLFSGGYDSMVASDIAARWARLYGHSLTVRVVSVDTLLSVDGWREFVTGTARLRRWPHLIWDNPNPEWYEQDVLAHGFPYTRVMHRIMYIMLKERAIKEVLKHYKKFWHDRVMFVTGIRRDESPERWGTVEHEKRKADVWCNPLVNWTRGDLEDYRLTYGLPDNPFYDTVGGSGDCQCNWGNFIALSELAKYSPRLAAWLYDLNERVKAIHGWGWDEVPSKQLLAERAGQLTLPGVDPIAGELPFLCAGCERKEAIRI